MQKRKDIKEKAKEYFYSIFSEEKSEHSIAFGFALGTFFCILPTFGFTIWLLIIISLIFKNINKVSLFSPLIVWNPLLLFPIYYLSYKLGNFIYSIYPVISYNIVFLSNIYNISRRFLVGNFILALAISIFSYFIIRIIIKMKKQSILEKLKK